MNATSLRVLVVDGAPPDRESSAGERATVDQLDALADQGHSVTLLGVGTTREFARRVEALLARGIDVDPRTGGGPEALRAVVTSECWDAVIVHRPGPAVAATAVLAEARVPLTVHWGHDIHVWRLDAQEASVGGVPSHQRLVTQVSERRCWDFYDRTVYPTEREAEYVDAQTGAPGRGVAFPYYRLDGFDLVDEIGTQSGRAGCLMVGAAAHAPNRDAVQWAVTEMLPMLEGSDANLTIVGEWPADLRSALQAPGVNFTGRISDAELLELHATHLCLLAPLRFGAGSRRKLVGAMGLGLPVVTTSEGVRGLLVRDGSVEDGVVIADDAVSAVAAVTALRDDGVLWTERARTARARVGDVYGRSAFDAALGTLLDSRTAQR